MLCQPGKVRCEILTVLSGLSGLVVVYTLPTCALTGAGTGPGWLQFLSGKDRVLVYRVGELGPDHSTDLGLDFTTQVSGLEWGSTLLNLTLTLLPSIQCLIRHKSIAKNQSVKLPFLDRRGKKFISLQLLSV